MTLTKGEKKEERDVTYQKPHCMPLSETNQSFLALLRIHTLRHLVGEHLSNHNEDE